MNRASVHKLVVPSILLLSACGGGAGGNDVATSAAADTADSAAFNAQADNLSEAISTDKTMTDEEKSSFKTRVAALKTVDPAKHDDAYNAIIHDLNDTSELERRKAVVKMGYDVTDEQAGLIVKAAYYKLDPDNKDSIRNYAEIIQRLTLPAAVVKDSASFKVSVDEFVRTSDEPAMKKSLQKLALASPAAKIVSLSNSVVAGNRIENMRHGK